MTVESSILARGPWDASQVEARWQTQHFEPSPERAQAADEAMRALRERGSPSHDGTAARLVSHSVEGDRLVVDLQPIRWGLRLVEDDASESFSAICLTRAADGRWLAGRRAQWLASWPGRWALGAGGAVDPFESPIDTLARELREEWSVEPVRVHGEALVMLPQRMALFIGQAWLAEGAEVVADHEHDEWAWWPADVDSWPREADERWQAFARLVDTEPGS
ncbi:MAG TPA: NUDIX domain-containing protein [Solirubrobacteraceae bacterium]|nr:NUDIX domain-containing protein [Solirubrobacteraceae bacterium]